MTLLPLQFHHRPGFHAEPPGGVAVHLRDLEEPVTGEQADQFAGAASAYVRTQRSSAERLPLNDTVTGSDFSLHAGILVMRLPKSSTNCTSPCHFFPNVTAERIGSSTGRAGPGRVRRGRCPGSGGPQPERRCRGRGRWRRHRAARIASSAGRRQTGRAAEVSEDAGEDAVIGTDETLPAGLRVQWRPRRNRRRDRRRRHGPCGRGSTAPQCQEVGSRAADPAAGWRASDRGFAPPG